MMTHEQIAADDVIDRYVRGQLDAAASNEFEEHYFACDECFAAVQELEALRSAVRHAVDDGALRDDTSGMRVAPAVPVRRPPIIIWSLAASAVLAAGLGWMAFVQMPQLREHIAAVSADRDQLKATLDQALAKASAPAAVEANIAMVTLASERGVGDTPTVKIAAGAAHFLVVIDGPPSPSGRARLDVSVNGGAAVMSVSALVRDANGVWTVSLPAALFADNTYRLRLSADAPSGALLGEYVLRVRRATPR
jgi:anti-sigma factor RsiW